MNQVWPATAFENDLDDVDTRKSKRKGKKSSNKSKKVIPNGEEFVDEDDERELNQSLELGTHTTGKRRKPSNKNRTVKEQSSLDKVQSALSLMKDQVIGKQSRILGTPFFAVGMLLSMVVELYPHTQRYNVIVFLMLAAASEFHSFPSKSIRPQLLISVITLFSIGLDAFYLMANQWRLHAGPKTIVSLILICKACYLFAFLRNVRGSVRTRKYLHRRFRLFYIPLFQPRRIMRDVRGRLLAIGLLQAAATLSYLILLVVLMTHFQFSSDFLRPTSPYALHFFLLLKAGTSVLPVLMVLYDTDLVLAGWYFGLLGCAVPYVRNYILHRKAALGGFPLVFSYAKIRFQFLQFLKLLDIGCGMYGFYVIGYNFETTWWSMAQSLRGYYGAVIAAIVLSDYYVLALFMGVRWLLRRQKVLKAIDSQLVASDDSEIEEFRLEITKDPEEAEALLQREAQEIKNSQRHYRNVMKEDELRVMESARVDRSRPVVRQKGQHQNRDMLRNRVAPWSENFELNRENRREEGMSEEEDLQTRRRGEVFSVGGGESSSGEDSDEAVRVLLSAGAYDHFALNERDVLNPLVHSSGSRITEDSLVRDRALVKPAAAEKPRKEEKKKSRKSSAVGVLDTTIPSARSEVPAPVTRQKIPPHIKPPRASTAASTVAAAAAAVESSIPSARSEVPEPVSRIKAPPDIKPPRTSAAVVVGSPQVEDEVVSPLIKEG